MLLIESPNHLFFVISDMPEAERAKEEERLKDIKAKFQAGLAKAKEGRTKFGIK